MRHRKYGLNYYRIPAHSKGAGKIKLLLNGRTYLYLSVKDMFQDFPVIEEVLKRYARQRILASFT